MNFEAVIFDCDGVLVDSETIYVEVERQLLAEIGLHYELDDYQNRFNGLTSTDFIAALEREYALLGNGPFPADFAASLDATSMARMDKELKALPGIASFMEVYAQPAAVASSSRLARLEKKLRQTGLHEFFAPHIYSGEQVENGKPAPDLFVFAADQLAIEPARCLVIEDSVNGVRAGIAAGMTVWGFVGGGHAGPTLGDRLISAGADIVLAGHDELARQLL